MPRAADSDELEPSFPWAAWTEELAKSPFGALFFGPNDFGGMTPRRFRDLARKGFGPTVTVSVRGEEVLVALNA